MCRTNEGCRKRDDNLISLGLDTGGKGKNADEMRRMLRKNERTKHVLTVRRRQCIESIPVGRPENGYDDCLHEKREENVNKIDHSATANKFPFRKWAGQANKDRKRATGDTIWREGEERRGREKIIGASVEEFAEQVEANLNPHTRSVFKRTPKINKIRQKVLHLAKRLQASGQTLVKTKGQTKGHTQHMMVEQAVGRMNKRPLFDKSNRLNSNRSMD